jgi:hypothetical protein
MGLAERRKIKQLQDDVLPALEREIGGAAIPYHVDWASLENDAQALNFLDNLPCHRLNMALRTICVDDMGREAVRDGVRRIALRNIAEPARMQIAFEDGVLHMHCAYARGAEGMISDGRIRETPPAAL